MGSQKENSKPFSENIRSVAVCLPEDGQDRDTNSQRSYPGIVAEIRLGAVNPLGLSYLNLEDKKRLPNIPAIYFVIEQKRIIYVGKAERSAFRWISHHIHSKIESRTSVRIYWLEIKDVKKLQEVEKYFIALYEPELNYIGLGRKKKEIPDIASLSSYKLDTQEKILENRITTYLKDKEESSIPEILKECLKVPLTDRYRKTWEAKAAKILKSKGWSKKHNGKKRYWVREIPNLP
jgi:hypothetical protein